MKIAVQVDDGKNIININNTNEDGARKQAETYGNEGWVLVNSVPTFSIDQKHLWTVRSGDNVLVHIDTNQTPEEEKNTVITKLTLQNLAQSNEIEELKKISTAQTLQALQDAKDKEEQQKVITNLTVQILKLQQTNLSTDSVEK